MLYTNSGYGLNGLFKSTNGGVDWDPVWPPPAQPELAKNFTYNFANVLAMDPEDHLHLLLTFHEGCLPPNNDMCIVESTDGGTTWRLMSGDPSWSGSEGQVIFFLDNRHTWLWGSQTNGFWRTEDSGASWKPIKGMTTSHLQGSQVYRRGDGTFFVAAAADGVWRSPDGKVDTWRLVPNTGPIGGGIVSDGTTMYFSNCYFGEFCQPTAQPYFTSPENDGDTWTRLTNVPNMSQGGNLGIDRAHHVLYSSNLHAGFWRYVTQ